MNDTSLADDFSFCAKATAHINPASRYLLALIQVRLFQRQRRSGQVGPAGEHCPQADSWTVGSVAVPNRTGSLCRENASANTLDNAACLFELTADAGRHRRLLAHDATGPPFKFGFRHGFRNPHLLGNPP